MTTARACWWSAAVDAQSACLFATVGDSGGAAVSQQGLRVEHATRAQTSGVPVCGVPLNGNIRSVEVSTYKYEYQTLLTFTVSVRTQENQLFQVPAHTCTHSHTLAHTRTRSAHTHKRGPHTHSINGVHGCINGESLKRVSRRGCVAVQQWSKNKCQKAEMWVFRCLARL